MIGLAGQDTGIVHGHVSADERLETADPALLALQRRAGSDLGDVLAVPQLASIVRLAGRLRVVISRAVLVADGTDDIDLWVHAKPVGEGVDLILSGWTRQPVRPALDDAVTVRDADFLRAEADWSVDLNADLCLTRIAPLGPVPVDIDETVMLGRKLTALIELIADDDGDMPILTGLARGRGFEGQLGRLKLPGAAPVRMDATALVDAAGTVSGLRGTITLIGSAPLVATPEALAVPMAEPDHQPMFGERLEQVLRRPLSRIIANADSINAQQDGPIRRDYANYAADIASAGRHMLGLVDDLVDLQTVESSDFEPLREPIDLAELARKAAGLVGVRAQDKAIRIDRPMEDDRLPAIGDYRRCLQILVNLIGNAVRYSPEGSMVWIRTEAEGDSATVIVADQGRGIDPADHERIFERFERLNATEAGGSGLGLYISRRLARAMGGDITLDSASGQGARFMLTLPAA